MVEFINKILRKILQRMLLLWPLRGSSKKGTNTSVPTVTLLNPSSLIMSGVYMNGIIVGITSVC